MPEVMPQFKGTPTMFDVTVDTDGEYIVPPTASGRIGICSISNLSTSIGVNVSTLDGGPIMLLADYGGSTRRSEQHIIRGGGPVFAASVSGTARVVGYYL